MFLLPMGRSIFLLPGGFFALKDEAMEARRKPAKGVNDLHV